MRFLFFLSLALMSVAGKANKGTVLMFVAQDSAYYSEYVVFREALIASGYSVEVRSASANNATTYMVPNGTTISATANTLSGSSSAEFEQDFQNQFGSAWNASLDAIPSSISVQGSIQSVSNIDNYVGLVLAGGVGMLHYRVDGNYSANGTASVNDVQAAAEKLNALAIEALEQGKPVLAQCHSASVPVYWRIPNTSGPGEEALGYSILKDQSGTGFPDIQTGLAFAGLSVTYRSTNVVMVSSPNSNLNTMGKGDYKIMTTRDWYPQSVAHAAKTFINTLETYPEAEQLSQSHSVLIIHGGAIDTNNCSAANKSNDVPCNYGTGANLPADYTHVESLLSASSGDGYQFNVTSLDLSGALPFNENDVNSVETYLNGFDAVIFFKHWSTFVTDEIQNGLKNFTDGGKGLLSIHHGLYNDISGALNKNILVNEVLGVSSEMATWSAQRGNVNLYNTNYGHFISTYRVDYPQVGADPSGWSTNQNLSSSNLSRASLPYFSLFEETYNNTAFTGTPVFGNQENQITALFSNDVSPSDQAHTAGFCKLFNPTGDASVGRVVCLSPGESTESYSASSSYGQIIRNAIVWSANKMAVPTSISKVKLNEHELAQPNPFTDVLAIQEIDFQRGRILDMTGKVVARFLASARQLHLSHLKSGLYVLELQGSDEVKIQRIVKE